jgi:hypothetical protein
MGELGVVCERKFFFNKSFKYAFEGIVTNEYNGAVFPRKFGNTIVYIDPVKDLGISLYYYRLFLGHVELYPY